MATYKINKKVLLQESVGEVVRGGLQKYLGVNYAAKDGYKTKPDGSVSYTHPNSRANDSANHPDQPDNEMRSMEQYEKDFKHVGELGHH